MKLRGTWVMVVLIAVGAGLIVLGLTLGGGGDDSSDSGAAAAPTTGPPAAVTDDSASGQSSGEPAGAAKSGSAARGNGGADSGGAAGSGKAAGDQSQSPAKAVKKKSNAKPDLPPQNLEDLSPAERKKLHADLYKQGLAICGSFGPEELAKGFNLPSNDPAQLARLYAEAYEARTPSLVLPVQQGCLAGLKRWIAKHE